jgi:diacylglycerol O-acyltransferase
VAAGTGRRAVRAVQLGGRAVRSPSRAVNDVGKMLGSAQRVLGAPPAPPSPLLKRRGLGRRFETVEFPLARFRAAAKSAGGSVNDAYISAICGALRRYHEALGVPVDAIPLAMPVNLRTDDDPAGGNHFAGARIAAPVGEPDPARRIQLIREKVLTAVAEPAINALSYAAAVLSRIPTAMLGALSSLTSTTDVQASNVPGYPEPPYIAGAKILKTLPFGPLPGVPMMIILVTEGGNCFIGVHYDTASITDQELFAQCLQEGFDEVLALDPGRQDPERQHAATKGAARRPAAAGQRAEGAND